MIYNNYGMDIMYTALIMLCGLLSSKLYINKACYRQQIQTTIVLFVNSPISNQQPLLCC